ncbi:MAG: prephenate dehydratase, partial [Gammaproteobacteria bacterium]
DYGVVPVENSTEGAVNNTQDCLIDTRLRICGEEIVAIKQNLLVAPGASINDIRTIMSHPQSLAQCRHWLQENLPDIELQDCASNAEAARKVRHDSGIAAIAGDLASDTYGLEIAREAIQDQSHNRTRFLVLSTASTLPTGKDKTSILIYTENKPGALFRILEPFEQLQISLTKLETRPAKKAAWEYVFFIDFEGHHDDTAVVELFRRLQQCTAEIKILGSYPAGQW